MLKDHGSLDVSLSVINCISFVLSMRYYRSVQASLLYGFHAAYVVK